MKKNPCPAPVKISGAECFIKKEEYLSSIPRWGLGVTKKASTRLIDITSFFTTAGWVLRLFKNNFKFFGIISKLNSKNLPKTIIILRRFWAKVLNNEEV